MDQRAIENLFERNADMRLLELRHSETGRTAGAMRHVTSFGSDAAGDESVEIVLANAPRLRVAIAAIPHTGVIAGALVSVAIDVFNDGTAPAPESRLLLSLPLDAAYRTGTLRVDNRETTAPERLFGAGLPVARLPGGTSAKVVFQLQVLPGLNPLYLQPRIDSSGVAVVGAPGLTIQRSTGTHAAVSPPRPFYELEEDEHDADEAESALPIVPPVLPPIPTVAVDEAAPSDEAVASDAAVDEPDVVPAPVAVVPVADRMTSFRTLGPKQLELLDRLFAPAVPGTIAHFMLISTIVCHERDADTAAAEDASYAAFLHADGEALGRALVLARFGKAIDYRPMQAQLDTLAVDWKPARTLANDGPSAPRRLRRDLRETECRAIGGLLQPSERDPQLRLRIALLALAGATIEGVDRSAADACLTALAAYRSAVLAWLVPLCVASAAHAGAAPLPDAPANVDVAGRRLAAVLNAAFVA